MDSHTLVKEIKRLLTENKRKFVRFSLLFMVLLLAVQLVPLAIRTLQERNSDDEETANITTDGNPAVFEMYIEYEDGDVYTNTLLLEEALKTKENIQAAEKATGVEISDLLEMEKEMNYPKTARDRGAIGTTRDEASNIWLFIARVGTEEENLRVMQFFYDFINNDEVALLANKSTYVISAPRVLTTEELTDPNTLVEVEATAGSFSIMNVVAALVISVIGGAALAFILIVSFTFLSKKISYAFNFNWGEEDIFVLLDKTNPEGLERAVFLPQPTDRVVVVQDASQVPYLKETSNLQIVNSILDVDVEANVEEVVLLIQPSITEKAWYNEQREFLKVYRSPLKIIQLNDKQ